MPRGWVPINIGYKTGAQGYKTFSSSSQMNANKCCWNFNICKQGKYSFSDLSRNIFDF